MNIESPSRHVPVSLPLSSLKMAPSEMVDAKMFVPTVVVYHKILFAQLRANAKSSRFLIVAASA